MVPDAPARRPGDGDRSCSSPSPVPTCCVNGTGEAVDILYALPVALLAMSFGIRGGLVGAAVGFGLFAVVEVFDGVGDIDATGWITRGAGLFLLGRCSGRRPTTSTTGQRSTLAHCPPDSAPSRSIPILMPASVNSPGEQ